MHRFRRACTIALIVSAAISCACVTDQIATAEVWSGYTKSFTKPDDADFLLPENQDQITPNVYLTRGDRNGLFNRAAEPNYASTSPEFTEWATSINNPGSTIAATNFSNLVFAPWVTAFGGQGTHGLPAALTSHDAVVHLTVGDVYLDLRFTSWSQGTGGGFSYVRATLPGDFNGNGTVDAADYTVWRDTQGQLVVTGDGADIDRSGEIDIGDFNFWKNHLGDSVFGAGAGAGQLTASPAPEPAAWMLACLALIALGLRVAAAHGASIGLRHVRTTR